MKIEKTTLINTIKIINTFYSKKIEKLTINTDLKSIETNVDIIRQKNINDLKIYNNVDNRLFKNDLINFVLSIAEDENIKLLKSEYNKQLHIKNINLSIFTDYQNFAEYCHKNTMNFQYNNQGLIFNINQLNYAMSTYLIVENTLFTVEKLVHRSNYFKIVSQLLNEKVSRFWINGYYKDLLVHDRVSLFNDRKLNRIVCKRDYCSTSIYEKDNPEYNYIFNSGTYSDNDPVFKI